jgi:hypothetical protein
MIVVLTNIIRQIRKELLLLVERGQLAREHDRNDNPVNSHCLTENDTTSNERMKTTTRRQVSGRYRRISK